MSQDGKGEKLLTPEELKKKVDQLLGEVATPVGPAKAPKSPAGATDGFEAPRPKPGKK